MLNRNMSAFEHLAEEDLMSTYRQLLQSTPDQAHEKLLPICQQIISFQEKKYDILNAVVFNQQTQLDVLQRDMIEKNTCIEYLENELSNLKTQYENLKKEKENLVEKNLNLPVSFFDKLRQATSITNWFSNGKKD